MRLTHMEVKDGSAQTNLRRRTEQWKVTLQQAWVQKERSMQEEQASGEAGGEATGASPAEAGGSIEHEDVLRQALHGHEVGTFSSPPADEAHPVGARARAPSCYTETCATFRSVKFQ